jgi:hypothetical protein
MHEAVEFAADLQVDFIECFRLSIDRESLRDPWLDGRLGPPDFSAATSVAPEPRGRRESFCCEFMKASG